jgi:hypothetical protein
MLRLGRKWRYVPDRHYTGFRFYDTEARFDHIHERAKYIHLIRQKRYEIHSYARRRFLEDVLVPLKAYGAKWAIKRYKFEGHYIEIIQVKCGWYCVLVVLRNWSNPLYEEEVARIVRALDACAKELFHSGEYTYKRLYKCIIAPAYEHGQTKMERWRNFLHFFRMPYILLPSLVDSIARQAGIDYRHAYPSQPRWTTGACDCLRHALCNFFEIETTAAIDATEYHRLFDLVSRAPTPQPRTPDPSGSSSNFAPSPATTYLHIDAIMKPASKSPSLPMSGLDPPCAQRFPPSNPSRPVLSPPVPKRTASPRPSTLGEKEEAQLRMWIRDAKKMTNNRYYRIHFLKCFIIRNLALQRSPQHITALARALIREAWGLNRRTAQEYFTIAFSMLHDTEETSMIRNATNTRRKRIEHLYLKLLWSRDLQANPWRLVQYAMRVWGVRYRTAWEYEQAAWTAFNHKEEAFLDEAPASHLKTTYRTIHLCDLARNNPALAQEPIKLILKAMSLWRIQRRTANILVNRVIGMLQSSPKEASQ